MLKTRMQTINSLSLYLLCRESIRLTYYILSISNYNIKYPLLSRICSAHFKIIITSIMMVPFHYPDVF